MPARAGTASRHLTQAPAASNRRLVSERSLEYCEFAVARMPVGWRHPDQRQTGRPLQPSACRAASFAT